jgi:uncharacterized membrane protein YjfL (UPF0719 family)
MYSQDELFVLMIFLLGATVSWGKLIRQASLVWPYRYQAVARFPLLIALLLAAALLYFVLNRWSSSDVRDSAPYTFFYFVMGVGWLALCRHLLNYLDLCIRDDVLERGNLASGLACGGALLGFMACFAGGNVGDGPGWWVVIYSAILATGAVSLAWLVLDLLTGMADAISIDRDVAAGVRAGGFWIGAGIILGRAVAGNWVSFDDANRDFFFYGWPVLGLVSIALIIERVVRPGRTGSKPPFALVGALPAMIYIAVGFACLFAFGKP